MVWIEGESKGVALNQSSALLARNNIIVIDTSHDAGRDCLTYCKAPGVKRPNMISFGNQ